MSQDKTEKPKLIRNFIQGNQLSNSISKRSSAARRTEEGHEADASKLSESIDRILDDTFIESNVNNNLKATDRGEDGEIIEIYKKTTHEKTERIHRQKKLKSTTPNNDGSLGTSKVPNSTTPERKRKSKTKKEEKLWVSSDEFEDEVPPLKLHALQSHALAR